MWCITPRTARGKEGEHGLSRGGEGRSDNEATNTNNEKVEEEEDDDDENFFRKGGRVGKFLPKFLVLPDTCFVRASGTARKAAGAPSPVVPFSAFPCLVLRFPSLLPSFFLLCSPGPL
jgi:hypothetical protein